MEKDYWLQTKLEEMSHEEWEALCDGCSKCCLFKLREPGVPGVRFTNVVCRYMDMKTCFCTDYEHRHENVPECILLTPELVYHIDWLPKTCAYLLVSEGKDLPWWHPLKTGDRNSTRKTGNSVYGKVVSETEVDMDDLEDMVVNWFE